MVKQLSAVFKILILFVRCIRSINMETANKQYRMEQKRYILNHCWPRQEMIALTACSKLKIENPSVCLMNNWYARTCIADDAYMMLSASVAIVCLSSLISLSPWRWLRAPLFNVRQRTMWWKAAVNDEFAKFMGDDNLWDQRKYRILAILWLNFVISTQSQSQSQSEIRKWERFGHSSHRKSIFLDSYLKTKEIRQIKWRQGAKVLSLCDCIQTIGGGKSIYLIE